MKLPEPEWLTLLEALQWLTERGAAEDEARLNLPRAVRDNVIRSRGRSRKYTGHDTKTSLYGVAWDQASINWEGSWFSIPDERGYAIDISDVDISREDLAGWAGSNDPHNSKPEPPTPKDKGGAPPKYNWEAFYIEAARHAHDEGLPATMNEMVRIMAEWCQLEWGREPSLTQMKTKLRPFFNAIREGDN